MADSERGVDGGPRVRFSSALIVLIRSVADHPLRVVLSSGVISLVCSGYWFLTNEFECLREIMDRLQNDTDLIGLVMRRDSKT